MLDVAVAYNRYIFLGNEFLTWLWYMLEKQPAQLKAIDADLTTLEIGNRIVLQNRRTEAVETITIKGDDAGLEEGIMALKKGALVTEINLVYRSGEQNWQFTLKGESLNISSLKTPDTGLSEKGEDIEGAVLEKMALFEKIVRFTECIFRYFIRQRVSDKWESKILQQVRMWIQSAA